MNKTFILAIAAIALLLAGCTQPAAPEPTKEAPGAAFPTSVRYFDFGTFTNNSTTDALAVGGVMDSHAFEYAYGGNWTLGAANVSLQGSIDGTHWLNLIAGTFGNTNGTNFTTGKPVVWVRAVVSGWNTTTSNATFANLTIKYVGKG